MLLGSCLLAATPSTPVHAGTPDDVLARTKRFAFHTNLWLNEHHFLYHVAKNDEALELLAPFEDEERALVEQAVAHYRAEVIERDLMFNAGLFELKRWLIEQPLDGPLPERGELSGTVAWLNRVRPAYEARLWPRHRARNTAVLERHLPDVRRYEKELPRRLARLAGAEWPEGRIRIDICYYTNWAGAYTTVRPEVHVVTRSLDDGPPGDWIETLFHESAHALIGGRRGTVSETIAAVAQEQDRPVPRLLWHAILFYLVGRVVQDRVEADTGAPYVQYLIREHVFDDYLPALEARFEPYVRGEIDLTTAIRQTLTALPREKAP